MGAVIDWTLATHVARGVSRLQPAGDPAPFEALEGPSERERAPRLRLHRARAVRAAARRRGRRPRRVGRGQPRLAEGRARSGRRPPRRRARGRWAASSAAASAPCWPPRRARSPASSRAACSGSTSSRSSIPRRRPGCCSWPRTSATPPAPWTPSPISCCAGSHCTRPRTRCSSARCRGCASTSRRACRSCSAPCPSRAGACCGSPTRPTSRRSWRPSARAGSRRWPSARSGASCSTACRR